jgi:hypothetical protein
MPPLQVALYLAPRTSLGYNPNATFQVALRAVERGRRGSLFRAHTYDQMLFPHEHRLKSWRNPWQRSFLAVRCFVFIVLLLAIHGSKMRACLGRVSLI